ncbi:hypothetical protein VTK26DRAFT_5484 [Humicola hyalothermophila]
MATTLLPFLYQTKTLQRLSATGISTPALRSLFHSSARCQRRIFLPRRPRIPLRLEPGSAGGDSVPFELPEGYEHVPTKDNPYIEQDPETGLRSTITPSEREAFNRIFQEIAAKKSQKGQVQQHAAPSAEEATAQTSIPARLPPDDEPKSAEVDDFPLRTKYPSSGFLQNTVNIILQDAAENQSKSRRSLDRPYDPLHPLAQTEGAKEWEKALLRFPPSLRKAAQMALGVGEADRQAAHAEQSPLPIQNPHEETSETQEPVAQVNLSLNPLSQRVQNEALRREERNRVEARMQEAKTDFELWDVLEEEVFPMVQKLGLNDLATTSKRKRASKKNSNSDKKDKKLPMHIYGPLYPAYLLNALRLLDRNFTVSSPLVLQLLPRVKELGLASYVLGVSTPFYNELARILWRRYGDPVAVFNLLEEMRAAGLYLDESTLGLVMSIQNFLKQAQRGKLGPFLGELATLPQYEWGLGPRVRHWLKSIHGSIEERKGEVPL